MIYNLHETLLMPFDLVKGMITGFWSRLNWNEDYFTMKEPPGPRQLHDI